MRGRLDVRMILLVLAPQHRFLCRCQPGRILRLVLKVEIGGDAQERFDAHMEVLGQTKQLKIQYNTPYIRHLPATLTVQKKHGEAGCSQDKSFPTRYDSFGVEWRDFHENIARKRTPKTSIADAREDLVIFKQMIELM